MTIVLNLPPEVEARLREQSARTGKVPEELALRALEEQLISDEQPFAALSAEEWVEDIRAWASSHRCLPHNADDSRESFYAGRGE